MTQKNMDQNKEDQESQKDTTERLVSNSSRRVVANALYIACYKYFRAFYQPINCMVFKEVHLEKKLRADVIGITWDEDVTILEIKSCREDYTADHKWRNYLGYCNKFYFVCPEGVITPEELPDEAGLIYVSGGLTSPNFAIIKKCLNKKALKITDRWFKKLYKKLAFRKTAKARGHLIELEDEIFFKSP